MKTFGELKVGDKLYWLIHDSVSDPVLGIWHKPMVEELTIESVVCPAIIRGPIYSYMTIGQDGNPDGVGSDQVTYPDESKVDITVTGNFWPRTFTVPLQESLWGGYLATEAEPLREIATNEKVEFVEKLRDLSLQVTKSITDE